MRILVVDDNPTNLDLMLYLLRAFDHDPEGAHDAETALATLKSGRFSLVLSDILMPGIDGYEFARRLRAQPSTAATPLVAVTALAMIGDRERIADAGFDGYIAKPIDPQTFVSDVEAYLRYADGRWRPS